jgi:hypothetical protein
MGEIPLSRFEQIEFLQKEAERFFAHRPYVNYEHGRAGHCVKLKGSQVTCHHFHLHFVPLQVDILSSLPLNFTPRRISKPIDVRFFYERLGEYLFFENSSRESFFCPAHGAVAPHLLRTLVCEAAGLSERSDWERL